MNDNTNNIELNEENDNIAVTACDETETSEKKGNAWVGAALLILVGAGIVAGVRYIKRKREASKKNGNDEAVTVTVDSDESETVE